MHHKFCLIDEKTEERRMFVGSLNLTLQALTSNWDDLMFTDNPDMIKRFADEFEELWQVFTFS